MDRPVDATELFSPEATRGEDPRRARLAATESGQAASSSIGLPALNPQQTGLVLSELRMELNRLQRSVRLTVQARLTDLQGRSCETFEANRELATALRELLDGHGLRVQCSECGHPAILRVSPRKGSPRGAFVFDHSINGRRTFHGGAGVVPTLKLVAKPVRKKR